MSIKICTTRQEVREISGTKQVWHDVPNARWVVRTGEDIETTPVATLLSARQFWLALNDLGILPSFKDFVATLPERDRIAIERATEFDRTFPQFIELASRIGTPEQIDALFAYGANL